MLNGILLVDKPSGVTSHTVVSRARRSLGLKKVGHAGTLDPLATGLLVLGVGPATRLLTFMVGLDKSYDATVRLGESTVSDDSDGERTALAPAAAVEALTQDSVAAAFSVLEGDIEQIPSAVSAIKINGERAYARVRAGEDVELAPRPVRIARISVGAIRRTSTTEGHPTVDVDISVDCSSGTYIRAIARDAGAQLGVGGHLTMLRRTTVGEFRVADAVTLDSITPDALLTPALVASRLFPTVQLTDEQALALSQGKRVDVGGESGRVAAIDQNGRLVGIADRYRDRLRVVTNFPWEDAS